MITILGATKWGVIMIKMSYPEIVAKIQESKSITESEIEEKVKAKMDVLSGLISKDGAAYIVANELGVKLVQTSGVLKVKDILVGMRSLETAGKVIRKFPINEFERNGKAGKVGSMMIADETGQIRVTAWHDMTSVLENVAEGDVVKITNAYVRENNGFKELHLNSQSKLIVNPEGVKIDVDVTPVQAPAPKADRKKISELVDAESAEILGTVVQVFDPKFFPTCPSCGKKAEQVDSGYNCREHGIVQPKMSYVMNAFLDDGSDSIRVVFFRNQALNFMGIPEEQMLSYQATPDSFESVKTDLLGEQVKIVGRVARNDMFDRLEMVARLVFKDVKPEAEINKLKSDGATMPETPKAEPAQEEKPEPAPEPTPSPEPAPQPDPAPSPEPEPQKEPSPINEPMPPKPAEEPVEDEPRGESLGDQHPTFESTVEKKLPSIDDL
jgi:hypothetical protein